MTIAGVTLESLKAAVQHAGVQAEMLRLRYTEPGATSELIDNVARELEHCYERLDNEIKVLRRHGSAS